MMNLARHEPSLKVTIPAGERLRLLLDRTVRRSPMIWTTIRGKP